MLERMHNKTFEAITQRDLKDARINELSKEIQLLHAIIYEKDQVNESLTMQIKLLSQKL